MMSPAVMNMNTTELVIERSTGPNPGNGNVGRFTILWTMNCSIGSIAAIRPSVLVLRPAPAHPTGRLHRRVGRRRRSQQQADHHAERRGVRDMIHDPSESQPPKHPADHLAY